MYKSLKLNQRNIFDLIPGMTVIFSDNDFTTTVHSEAAYLAWIRALRRDVPVGVPLDLSTPTGMSCIGTFGENCKSDNVSKYCVSLVAFLLLWHENWCHGKNM